MANTFTQIYIHIVFAVKYRHALISAEHKEDLQKYLTGLFSNRSQKMLAINCMPDHLHALISMSTEITIASLIHDIKIASTKHLNSKGWFYNNFAWQTGYGAFSCSRSVLQNVINYIHKQEEHHRKRNFREEFLKMLEDAGIDYDERYIFKDPE